ncbi:MAG TPA: hypothetical protein VER96_25310 [Polyangiaceae bacterium]|nr:hypothetical protein [Polyangiaceae bacterium]
MTRPGFSALFTLVLLAGLDACEGREIVVFAPAQAGSAGAVVGTAGMATAGAPGGSAGFADPGGNGGAASGSGGTGGSTDKPCQSNTDCDGSLYCQKQNCGDSSGVCLPIPLSDDPQFMPVCGCEDHVTYWNDNLRKIYGVSASTPGSCMSSAKPCFSSSDCGSDGTCSHQLRDVSACSMPGIGQCWIIPNDCGSPGDKEQFVPCPPPPGSPSGCPPIMTLCEAMQSDQPFLRSKHDIPGCP